jgi:hypothetical protein
MGGRAAEALKMHRWSHFLAVGASSLATAVLLGCATGPTAPAVSVATTAEPPAGSIVAVPAQGTIKQAQIEVVSAQFGVFGADDSGRRILLETDRFPAVISAPYGWYIIFKTEKPTVVWREEFELPIAPPTWGPGEAMGIYTISPDRKTAVTERIIPTRLGFVANEWRYAPGDPLGAHAMRVYLDGQLIREFKFDIEEGPAQQKRAPRTPERGSST